MIICTSTAQLKQFLPKDAATTLGFVPTMGALHAGHASLIKKAKEQCDSVAVSIFVNPKQFNNPNDLASYPNRLEEDKALLMDLGVDILFAPDYDTMYGGQLLDKKYNLGELENTMEGAFRPGHFQGVAAAVDRLFQLIPAHKSYFGEKDYQQVAVIRRLKEICHHATDIIAVPTARSESGLALSSRNLLLSDEQLAHAALIYKGLISIRENYPKLNTHQLKELFRDIIHSSKGILETEYIELADEQDLTAIDKTKPSQGVRAFTAVKAGNIRLIDNLKIC